MWEDCFQVYRRIGENYTDLMASDMTIDNAILFVRAWMQENFNDQQTSIEIRRQPMDYRAESPATDVAPVRRGKWIEHQPFDNGRKNCNVCIECSECHTWFGYDFYAKTNYCPNCGAHMTEGERE